MFRFQLCVPAACMVLSRTLRFLSIMLAGIDPVYLRYSMHTQSRTALAGTQALRTSRHTHAYTRAGKTGLSYLWPCKEPGRQLRAWSHTQPGSRPLRAHLGLRTSRELFADYSDSTARMRPTTCVSHRTQGQPDLRQRQPGGRDSAAEGLISSRASGHSH